MVESHLVVKEGLDPFCVAAVGTSVGMFVLNDLFNSHCILPWSNRVRLDFPYLILTTIFSFYGIYLQGLSIRLFNKFENVLCVTLWHELNHALISPFE